MAIVTMAFPAYNPRRYSRPWGAKVVPDAEGKKKFIFGEFSGGYNGEEGTATVVASAGDIVAFDQKDYLHPKNSRRDYYMVEELDGKITLSNLSDCEAPIFFL